MNEVCGYRLGSAREIRSSPGAGGSCHRVPVSGRLLRTLGVMEGRSRSPCIMNASARSGRPHSCHSCFNELLGQLSVPRLIFRKLERAFTAQYVRDRYSCGAIDIVLNRSGITAALGLCIRPGLGRGGQYVSHVDGFLKVA